MRNSMEKPGNNRYFWISLARRILRDKPWTRLTIKWLAVWTNSSVYQIRWSATVSSVFWSWFCLWQLLILYVVKLKNSIWTTITINLIVKYRLPSEVNLMTWKLSQLPVWNGKCTRSMVQCIHHKVQWSPMEIHCCKALFQMDIRCSIQLIHPPHQCLFLIINHWNMSHDSNKYLTYISDSKQ